MKQRKTNTTAVSIFFLAFAIVVASVTYAGIRMTDDPKEYPAKSYTVKYKNVNTGSCFFQTGLDSTYEIGDIFCIDSSGALLPYQSYFSTKVIVIARYPENTTP